MKIKLTKTVEAKDCTRDFFKKGEDPNKNPYAIVKFSEDKYAVVERKTHMAMLEFKSKTKVYDETWLITLEDDTQCLMRFSKFVLYSEPFLRAVKRFKRYLLVEKTKGVRKLMKLNEFSVMFDWIPSEYFDYAILELPNNNLTILKKDGLEVSDIEFDSVSKTKFFNFVIVSNDCGVSVVRISDFKRTLSFLEVLPYVPIKCESYSENYVIVTHNNDKKSILRLEDFKLSDSFNNIIPITHEYALVTDNGKEEILRLSDFKIAKFD